VSKQFRIKRTYSSIPVVAGGFATIDLPRGYDYESLYMRITGSVQVTAAATSVRAEAPCQVVSRVEVIADGRNTLYSAPFWFSAFGSYDRAGALAQGARVTTPPSGAGIATYAVEAVGTIDFCNIDGERTKDSNFRTDGLQLFQLRLTFGNAIDMFVPGAGAATYTTMAVEITTTETVELPDAQGARTSPVALKKVSYQEIAVPTTNANQEVRLPAGNMIKSVVIRTEGGATAGEPGANVLNNLQVFSGVDVRHNVKSNSIRALNNADYGYILPGYYIVDLARNGNTTSHLSELWDVSNQAEPKVSLDITGGAAVKAQVVTTEFLALQ
jgi:hypothetical protein